MLKKVSHINSLKGTITIPSDKSISHRAVMFSSIAEGECTVSNFSSGADCHSTLNLFKSLGVDIQFIDEKTLKIKESKRCAISRNFFALAAYTKRKYISRRRKQNEKQ